mgnify:CR=1 FL=1
MKKKNLKYEKKVDHHCIHRVNESSQNFHNDDDDDY